MPQLTWPLGAASITDLDLNHNRHHGICMPNPDQTFSLWMEGDLVATGRNGCDMQFVSSHLQTPECSSDMWVAIQAVDAEATSFGGHSKGGIKAAFEWCGQEIHTDDTYLGVLDGRRARLAEPAG